MKQTLHIKILTTSVTTWETKTGNIRVNTFSREAPVAIIVPLKLGDRSM